MTLREACAAARRQLAAALKLPEREAAIEADMLLRDALGDVSRAWLISHDDEALAGAPADAFAARLARRLAGEPVAYILGRREFHGHRFAVSPDVLIPRPDTETLVEAALAVIPPDARTRVLDLGCGSGIVAIAIALARPQAQVIAIDQSAAAVALSRANAARLGAGNVACRESDWFAALTGEVFDVIVSNPPYIAAGDPHLMQGDLRFEPERALASGADGLDDIRHLAAAAPAHLAPGGWLLLEHGFDQAAAVQLLLRQRGYAQVGSLPDLAGIARVTRGQLVQAVAAAAGDAQRG